MKDFRELLQEKYNDSGLRSFGHIAIGNFRISIQASDIHYSNPRRVLKDVYDYSDFEVALFEKGKWIFPSRDNRFADFSIWADEWLRTCIFPYMPVADVQKLYETVCALADTEGQG